MLKHLTLKTSLVTGLFLSITSLSCKDEAIEALSAEVNQTANSTSQATFYKNSFINETTFNAIIKDLNTEAKAKALFKNSVTDKAKTALNAKPDPVVQPKVTDGIAKIAKDGNHIYALAMQSFFFQNETDTQKYIDKAAEFLLAWANIGNRPAGHTPDESTYDKFYKGYSLIRERLKPEDRTKIDNWIKSKYDAIAGYQIWESNWESAKVFVLIEIATALQDQTRIQKAKTLINNHLDKNYRGDGVTRDFRGRDAFAYHVYELQFISQIIRSLATVDGADIVHKYAYTRAQKWIDHDFYSGDKPTIGGTFADAINFLEPYVLNPQQNEHLEFVATKNGPDKNRGDYNKPYNASGSAYAFYEMAFLMKTQMLKFIQKNDPNFNKYSQLNYYLNSFGVDAKNTFKKDVVVYSTKEHRGTSVKLDIGRYSMNDLINRGIKNDDISAISITKGLKVTLFEHNNFEGKSLLLGSAVSDLSRLNFDDQTSSIIIEEAKSGETVSNPPQVLFSTIYPNTNYSGTAYTLSPGTYTLQDLLKINGFKNNDASSIKVEKGLRVTLFDGDYMTGTKIILTENLGYLSNRSFNDKMSSILVEDIKNPSNAVVTTYSNITHSGSAINLKPGGYTLADLQKLGVKNKDISSVKVSKGLKVTLFDGENLNGNKLVLTSDEKYLSSYNFNDKTSSILIETVK